ncbi:MAG TPA: thioredoxin family protein [Fodinibius sp.]|nr:thioredoxin family protein [Fodinibius sp.]
MSYTKEQLISPDIIENAMGYEAYREMIDDLLAEGKTTGDNHADEMIGYSRMNVQRMKRLDKQVELTDELTNALQENDRELIWLGLTEAWCGDAAQNIPVIAKMARESDRLTLRLILRDEHIDIMDQYLTNGGRSIPKLVCLDAETLDELGSWGPRPGNFQQQVIAWMDDPDLSQEEWGQRLHKWYAKDKTQTLQSDFVKLIAEWSKK